MADLRWGAATDPGRIRPDNEDNLLAEPQRLRRRRRDGRPPRRRGRQRPRRRPPAGPPQRARRRPRAGRRGDRRGQRRHLPGRHRQPRPAGHGHDGHRAGRDRDVAQPSADDTESDGDTADDAAGEPAPATGRRAAGPRQRRRLAHLPAAPRPAAPGHGRPQLRPGAGRHRPHHRRRGPHPPPPQHRHPRPRHRPRRPRRRVDAAARARRPLPAVQRRPRRRGARRRDRRRAAHASTDPQAAADELVALANRQGGRDNITVDRRRRARGRRPARSPTASSTSSRRGTTPTRRHVGGRRPRGRGHRVRRPRRARRRRRAGDRRRHRPTVAAAAAVDRHGEPPTGRPTPTRRPSPRASGAEAPAHRLPRAASACSPCSCWRSSSPSAWARRGFFVAFDDDRRRRDLPRPHGRLPVVRSDGGSTDRRSSADAARRGVDRAGRARARASTPGAPPSASSAEQLETTTTTSTTTTTTTTTTVPPSTTTADDRRAVMAPRPDAAVQTAGVRD